MADRKAFPLRLDPAMYDALQRWAGADLRSLNAQIEFLLRRALRERVTVSAQTLAVDQRRGEHPRRIVTYEPGGVPPWAVPLLSGALLAAAAGITWRLRRDWVLLSEGRAALARVTSQKKVHR